MSQTTWVRRSPTRAAIAAGSGEEAPSRSATAGRTNSASRSGASGTKTVPPSASSPSRRASSIAKRVLPVPPGPTIVRTRGSRSYTSETASNSSCSRPRNERCRSRELDTSRRAQRRELTFTELVDAHRAVEVLEPVLTEVAERLRVEERRRGRRHEDLIPVRERGDARAAVHVLADVALFGRGRSARVQAHAHADRSRLEPLARRPRGLRRSSGRRETQ